MKLANVEDIYPLSPMQQGMLFHSLYEPGSGMYFNQLGCQIEGGLDTQAFRQAWERVIQRHGILRTAFLWENLQEPIQAVRKNVDLPWHEEDWRGWSAGDQAEKWSRFLAGDRQRGFNLKQAPLLRFALIRTSDESFYFGWSYHHILLDGWCQQLVMQEVFALYEAYGQGITLKLDEPRPYRDYIRWLQQQDQKKAESFWREELEGFSAPTRLGIDHGRELEPGEPAAGETGARLSPALTQKLESFAREQQVTLNTVVQGAWAVLLARHSGEPEVVFGATASGRSARVQGIESMLGVFINTLPVRVQVQAGETVAAYLKRLQRRQADARDYEYSSLSKVQEWSEVPRGTPLFDYILLFENLPVDAAARERVGAKLKIGALDTFEINNFPLTLTVHPGPELSLRCNYNGHRFTATSIDRMLGNLEALLTQMAEQPQSRIGDLSLLNEAERKQMLVEWNQTGVDCPFKSVHQLFEEQVLRTPENVAVVGAGEQLTYSELNARSNQLARYLRNLGAGPEVLVAICVERSLEMVVGLLAILKAGAAYLPLDPVYPADRLRFMVEDSQAKILLTQKRLLAGLPESDSKLVCLDRDWNQIAKEDASDLEINFDANQLAYVIYTSGSTGKPKGVQIAHRSVVNFFEGMDKAIHCGPEDTLLAVTGISFDISVLELFWTLTRGTKVVLVEDPLVAAARPAVKATTRKLDYSLFYFSSADTQQVRNKYRLLMEGAKYADQNGFTAVWTPERHFHEFGGLYPNPSVTGAALAAITERIQIRAGSVVLPLHNLLRVAEEWSVVDNLSDGRVGLSFASGWHANDFAFAPENYTDRRDITFRGIETFLKLWRGEPVKALNGSGKEVELNIFPRPIQARPPIWITAAGTPDTFIRAGQMGANILTHLLGQTVEDVAGKIKLYREALAQNGYDPQSGKVTLMLHTFLDHDKDKVKDQVRGPFTQYLRSSADLIKGLAKNLNLSSDMRELSAKEMDSLLAYAFERYFEHSALFGTVQSCAPMIDYLKEIGVDEAACLIDFGVDDDAVLNGLEYLNALKEHSESGRQPVRQSLGELAVEHKATLMQCTPAMMRMLAAGTGGYAALSGLRTLMLGGESLPPALAREVKDGLPCKLVNMYGPTETTIWSATGEVTEIENSISIGGPIANTTLYILDSLHSQPVPVGVAGELCIGGEGVARGYLRRPELTAERFMPNPFGDSQGSRIYRTGDLARYLPDGRIELLGRGDNQVKIRGHRIELGEIESELGRHPDVLEAVVVAHEDEPGEKRLVAYLVEHEKGILSSAVLRSYLQKKLPEYMLPSQLVFLEELPLTPNGKLDRKRLKTPESAGAEIELLPRDEVDLKLAMIWEDLLGVSQAGRRQSFFALGGNSLLAISLTRKIAEQFGQDIPLYALFEEPTIEHLGNILRRNYQAGPKSHMVPIQRKGSKPPLFFVHPLGGEALGYMPLARVLGKDQPFYALQAIDDDDVAREQFLSIEERAAQYIQALRKVQADGPYYLGGWSFGGFVAYEMAQQLRRQNQEVAALILLDIRARVPKFEIPEDDAEYLVRHAASNAIHLVDEYGPVELTLAEFALKTGRINSAEERVQYVIDQLIKAGILPSGTEAPQVLKFVRALRQRERSQRDYVLRPYSGPITLMRPLDNLLSLEDSDIDPADRTQGFAEMSSLPVSVHFVPGHHLNMLQPPNVQSMAEALKPLLDQATDASELVVVA